MIRIDRQLDPLPLYRGRKLARGQKVVAIGSPLGMFNSVSDGIISGFREIDSVDMIQFTAPISHGSSGGALLNMQGEVIGISTAGIDEGQNLNLAVSYEDIRLFVRGFTGMR
ncbi:putative serine protease HhoB [Lachnospiraceae bacterium]|nr:putative serine protease HhoB [Lachnospiraceae bacterium]